MKESGTTSAGRPQITGGPRVNRHFKRTHGRGTGNISLLGRTNGILPLTPRAVIHGSMVTDGAK